VDKLWPTLLILIVVALVFLAMWVGWRRRARRDSGLVVPTTLDAPGEVLLSVPALHVATTHHDAPLDRVVVPGLAFRANATVTVSRGGVTITAPGEPSVAIARNAVAGVGTATWTIDRSVEPDGLALIAWRAGPEHDGSPVLDTYLRLEDTGLQQRLVAGIRSIAGRPTTTTPGADDAAEETNPESED
jgi:hypothetical protein